MTRTLFALALPLLAACASSPSLSPDHLPQIDALVSAKQLALRGEELLAQDEAVQAQTCFEQARAICARILDDDPNHARAHRLVGRVKLRQWPTFSFADVRASFAAAKRSATTVEDEQRAQDYLELVDGLAAYVDGQPAAAWQAWSRITDPAIKDSVTAQVKALDADATFGGAQIN
jgi:hypothetical protein